MHPTAGLATHSVSKTLAPKQYVSDAAEQSTASVAAPLAPPALLEIGQLASKDATNCAAPERTVQLTQSNHAPLVGTRAPYGVMKRRSCDEETAHGPPASSGSPVTLIVTCVAGVSCGSEYSSVKRSYLTSVLLSCAPRPIVTSAPPLTMNVYPLGQP